MTTTPKVISSTSAEIRSPRRPLPALSGVAGRPGHRSIVGAGTTGNDPGGFAGRSHRVIGLSAIRVIVSHALRNISITVRPQAAPWDSATRSAAYSHRVSFTVGFDLDMTLIDPRAGIVEVFDVLAAESGIPLDGRAFVTRLGPPLQQEFVRYGLDEATIEQLIARYRALTPSLVVPRTVAMPGAAEAVRAVTDRGGRAVVVTAKYAAERHRPPRAAWASRSRRWSVICGAPPRPPRCRSRVPRSSSATTWATSPVPGPPTRSPSGWPPDRSAPRTCKAAGADVVLADLTRFPEWLESYLLATVH